MLQRCAALAPHFNATEAGMLLNALRDHDGLVLAVPMPGTREAVLRLLGVLERR